MPALREVQEAFAAGVLFGRAQPACTWISARGLAPERRLAIYRNNTREGFLKTLTAAFPVLVRLAGEAWFRQTGHIYMCAHPSRSGNLHHVGERFPHYLRAQLGGMEFEYFADVAALEWAYQEVLVAAESAAMDASALQRVAPEDYDRLAFTLRPAARLIASPYPILAIWRANRAEASQHESTIRLDAGPSRVLVIRRTDHVELRELSRAEFALLQAFARGETLASAADAMLADDAQADLGAALTRAVHLGAFADFSLIARAPARSPEHQDGCPPMGA